MFIRHLTRWLKLPGLAGGAEPVWVTPRGVRPELLHLERADRQLGYYLVHGWLSDPEVFGSVEAMFRAIDGELVPHPVTVGDRTDPIIAAFDDERLWLWRVPILHVPAPGVFPERPKSKPPVEPTEVLTWIEVLLVDQDQRPVVSESVLVVDPDGTRHTLRTNEAGLVRVDAIHFGVCDISFPDLDGREWKKQS